MATLSPLPPTWDPYTTLDINPYDRAICIGHATTKRRECHSRVLKISRDKACDILDQLSDLNSISGMIYSLYHCNDSDINLISLPVVLGLMIYHYQ